MAEFPALPLWTDAYLADTGHLSTIEHGAYLLLLMTMWRSPDKRLPNDPQLLAKYCKLTNGQWARVASTLMKFFTVDGNSISQGRLTDEAMFVRRNSKKQSDNSKARWLKNKKSDLAMALPNPCQTDPPTPTPTPTKNIVDFREAKKEEIEKGFLEFYAAYPKKQAPKKAREAYAKARREVSHETIMGGLTRAKGSDSRFREIKFTPMPASWLNAGSWADQSSSPQNLGIV
jgi:uncharacterized protein YdaU (DUF1376 family)